MTVHRSILLTGLVVLVGVAACAATRAPREPQPLSTGGPVSSAQIGHGGHKEVLLVAGLYLKGPGVLDPGDAAIRDHLKEMGYAVTIKKGADSRTGDALGKALIIISSTNDSDAVGTKFRDVAVPVIDDEHAVFDDMKMTAPKYWRDFGYDGEKTSLSILDPSHPLAGGLTGTVAVTQSPQTIVWAIPPENAIKVAAHTGDPKKVAMFAYDTGMTMYGLKAPARRIGFFFYRDTAAAASKEGWTLFDAAVAWAVQSPAPGASGGRR